MTSIDSLTIMTPIGLFVNPPDVFSNLITVDDDTGEIMDSKPKPVISEEFGIKIRCWITNVFKQQYVSFTFTSKMLGKDYLKGLNRQTIVTAFEYASLKLGFSLDFRDFLEKSIVTDIDFKRDVYMPTKSFTDKMRAIKAQCSYAKLFNRKGNYLDETQVSGLQFVNRKDANISKPFVKFYDKYVELLENSREFYDNFLSGSSQNVYDVKRQEVTIKNVEHLRSVLKIHDKDIKVNSLEYVINIDSSRIEQLINEVTERHFAKVVLRQPQQNSGDIVKFVRPRDYFTVMLMRELMLQGSSMKELFLILNGYPALNPNTKSRIIKDLKAHFKRVLDYSELETLTVSPSDAFNLKTGLKRGG